MRLAPIVLALLLAACASRDGIIDEEFHDCDGSGPVSITALMNIPGVAMEGTEDRLTMTVIVSNNSHEDIEVKAIRVEPGYTAQRRYELLSSYREFRRVIEPGEEEKFELPVTGRALARTPDPAINREDVLSMNLSVYLDGDTYRCRLGIPAPR